MPTNAELAARAEAQAQPIPTPARAVTRKMGSGKKSN